MAIPLRVLIVEDSEDDALLLLHELRRGGFDPVHERVDTAQAMRASLGAKSWDVITCDYVMPYFDGHAALKLAQESGLDLPFIIVSGQIGEEIAVEAMKAGAHDFVMKNNLARLIPAITREVREAETRRQNKSVTADRQRADAALRASEIRYRRLFEAAKDGILILDAKSGEIIDANPFLVELLRYRLEDCVGRKLWEIDAFKHVAAGKSAFQELLDDNDSRHIEVALEAKDGRRIDVEFVTSGYEIDSKKVIQCNIRDVSERTRQQQELKFKNAILSTQQDTSRDGILVVDDDGKIISYNRAFGSLWDIPDEERSSHTDARALLLIVDKVEDREQFLTRVNYLYTHKDEKSTDEIQQKNGRTLERYSAPMRGADGTYYGRVWYFRDITQRKQSESVLRRSLEDSILAFAATIESRDPYTAGHQRRVAELTVAIAREMRWPEEDIRGLQLAATIHDLGKIHIPAEILSKPGRLTPLEYELIKTHSEAGYEILKDIAFPWPIAELVLQHHERIDGSGYPRGLRGEQISMGAKILAVADTVEAMSSHRPYRPGFGIDVALQEILKNRGRLYDPTAADTCVKLFREQQFAFSS